MDNSRQKMIDDIRDFYGLDSPRVFSAMLDVPREKFVAASEKHIAYSDNPVSIGYGQTMSQPYTVAFMTHLLISQSSNLRKKQEYKNIKGWKILEIGTGSGYQAAILSKLVKEVYTVEIIPELARKAKKTLAKIGSKNVFVKEGSGECGWEEKSPFDAIIVTAGVEDKVPKVLFDQLKVGGVLVAPVGKGYDKVMTRIVKTRLRQGYGEARKTKHGIFHFVPFMEVL